MKGVFSGRYTAEVADPVILFVIGMRGIGTMQYWKDLDLLEAFAHDKNQPHLKSWQKLAVQTQSDRTFGCWHRTYEIEPDNAGAVYGSMPIFGLAAASNHVGLKAEEKSARDRLK